MADHRLERTVISEDWMGEYRREHISRAFEVRLKGGLIKPRHPHRNNPYCNICDEDYDELDLGYRLYVGGRPVVYHVDCIEANLDTKKVKNIVAQDRGFRKRVEGAREAANELKIRSQLYRFVIGSVLNDALADHSSRGKELLSPVESLRSVGELGTPVSASSVDGLAEAATRGAARGTVVEKLL
jgi:hypothetical protein